MRSFLLAALVLTLPASAWAQAQVSAQPETSWSRAIPPETSWSSPARAVLLVAEIQPASLHTSLASPDDPLADTPDAEHIVHRTSVHVGSDASQRPVIVRGPVEGDVRCVAQAVYHEARGESSAGQKAVAAVVLNRTRTGRWGRACSVISAPGQFTGFASWHSPSPGEPAWDRAIEIARQAVAGVLNVNLSPGTLFFRAARMGAGSARFVKIGNHVFW